MRSTDPERIKRPPNSFLLFRSDFCKRQRLENAGKKFSQAEVSAMASAAWKTPGVKQAYEMQAAEIKRQHEYDHPSYKFQPKRRERGSESRKTRKNAATSSSEPPPSSTSTARAASRARTIIPEEAPPQTNAPAAMLIPSLHSYAAPAYFYATGMGQGTLFLPTAQRPVSAPGETDCDSEQSNHDPLGCSPTMSAATYSPPPSVQVIRGYSSSVSPLSPTTPLETNDAVSFGASFTYVDEQRGGDASQPILLQPEPVEAAQQQEIMESVPFTWANTQSLWTTPQHQNNAHPDIFVADVPTHGVSSEDEYPYPQHLLDGTANFDPNNVYNMDEAPNEPLQMSMGNPDAFHGFQHEAQQTFFESHEQSQHPSSQQHLQIPEQSYEPQMYYWNQGYGYNLESHGTYSGDISPVGECEFAAEPPESLPTSEEETNEYGLQYDAYGNPQYTRGVDASGFTANYIAARTGVSMQSMQPM